MIRLLTGSTHTIAQSDTVAASLSFAATAKRSQPNLRILLSAGPATAAPKTPSADISSAGSAAAKGVNTVMSRSAAQSEFRTSVLRQNRGALCVIISIIPERTTEAEKPNIAIISSTAANETIEVSLRLRLPKSSQRTAMKIVM